MTRELSITVLSGGLDSSVLAYYIQQQGTNQICLTFDYGQRHNKEIESAKQITELLSVEHSIVDISSIKTLLGGSSLTDDVPVPHGHYESESMKQTVVPNRNAIMLSLAYAKAVSVGASCISYAAHSGDHFIYPDCRPDFVQKLETAFQSGNDSSIGIYAPFLGWSKDEIVRLGIRMGVPFEKTWTCYEGGDIPCGKCGSCVERAESFSIVNEPDPLIPIAPTD